jgi:hypothetical protein
MTPQPSSPSMGLISPDLPTGGCVMTARSLLRLLASLLLLLVGTVPLGSQAAAPLTVCPHGCAYTSIQAAIDAAPSGTTITIGRGTYREQLTIDNDLTLLGSGADGTIIDGGGAHDSGSPRATVVVFPGSTARLAGVTLTGGSRGGLFTTGALTLENSVVAGNRSQTTCGGVCNGDRGVGTLTIKNTTIRDNTAPQGSGAGIENDGALTLLTSTVSGNAAAFQGGGILNWETMTIANSRIVANRALFGGGVNNQGELTVRDSRISDNSATGQGGGVYNNHGPNARLLTLINSQIIGNRARAGGGLFNQSGPITLTRSRVSGNIPDDCVGVAC